MEQAGTDLSSQAGTQRLKRGATKEDPAAMMKFVPVAKLSDLEPGSCLSVEAEGGMLVALFNVDGIVYALDNSCPHAGGPLGEGALAGEIVECPWHGWRFNVRTGVRVDNPDFRVACYEVQVEENVIKVSLPISW